jgi:hypothetical protein
LPKIIDITQRPKSPPNEAEKAVNPQFDHNSWGFEKNVAKFRITDDMIRGY